MGKDPENVNNALLTILDSLDAIVYVVDIKTYGLLFLNQYAKNIYGEVVGKLCWQAMRKGQISPCVFCNNDKLKLNDKSTIRELENKFDNRWYSYRDRAIKWFDGRIVKIVVATDITERKVAEERISFHAKIFEDSLNEIYLFGTKDFKFINANKSALKNLGYSLEELKALTPIDIKPEFSFESFKQIVSPLLREEKKKIIFETTHKRKDESCYNVEVHLQILKNGEVVLFSAIILDITKRKKIEKSLLESEKKYRNLIEKSEDIIWRCDLDLRTTYVSASIERKLGFTPEERMTHNLQDQLTPTSYRHIMDQLSTELEKEKYEHSDLNRTINIEAEYYHKNGSTVWFENVASGIRDEIGNLVGFQGISRDINEKKKIEQALRNNEQNMASVLNNSGDGVVRIDRNHRHVFVNPAVYKATGLSPEQYLGKTNEEIGMPKELCKIWHEKNESVFQSGNPETVEFTFITKKRGKRDFQAVITPEFGEEGRVKTIVSFMRDITKLKMIEKALKESEALLDATGEMAKVGGWEVDASTLERKWTKQTYRIVELPFDYKPTKESRNFIHVDDREIIATAMQLALEKGTPFDLEHRITTAKGKNLWVRSICIPQVVDGKVVKLKGTFQDISELKQVEQSLRESERRYRSVIEFSPLGFAIKNIEGVVIDTNQALASMVGYEIEELLGSDFSKITHPDDFSREDELIQSLLNKKNKSFSMEKRYRHKNGNIFWVNLSVSKMSGLNDDEIFVFGFVEDISNRKKMELEREELIKKLQEALAEIKELRGFLPICANCKKIRDDTGYWQQIEAYITERTDAQFSHSICPECAKRLYPELNLYK